MIKDRINPIIHITIGLPLENSQERTAIKPPNNVPNERKIQFTNSPAYVGAATANTFF